MGDKGSRGSKPFDKSRDRRFRKTLMTPFLPNGRQNHLFAILRSAFFGSFFPPTFRLFIRRFFSYVADAARKRRGDTEEIDQLRRGHTIMRPEYKFESFCDILGRVGGGSRNGRILVSWTQLLTDPIWKSEMMAKNVGKKVWQQLRISCQTHAHLIVLLSSMLKNSFSPFYFQLALKYGWNEWADNYAQHPN